MRGTLQDRFWAKVHFGEPEECWLWTGSLGPTGYGYFHSPSGTMAH